MAFRTGEQDRRFLPLLRYLRDNGNESRRSFARRSGIPLAVLSRLINGQMGSSVDRTLGPRLAKATGNKIGNKQLYSYAARLDAIDAKAAA